MLLDDIVQVIGLPMAKTVTHLTIEYSDPSLHERLLTSILAVWGF
jgi:hypothetical protein